MYKLPANLLEAYLDALTVLLLGRVSGRFRHASDLPTLLSFKPALPQLAPVYHCMRGTCSPLFYFHS